MEKKCRIILSDRKIFEIFLSVCVCVFCIISAKENDDDNNKIKLPNYTFDQFYYYRLMIMMMVIIIIFNCQ